MHVHQIIAIIEQLRLIETCRHGQAVGADVDQELSDGSGVAGKTGVRIVTQHLQRHIRSIAVGDLDVQQEFCAVGCAHACYQICPTVFDPLMLGPQKFGRFQRRWNARSVVSRFRVSRLMMSFAVISEGHHGSTEVSTHESGIPGEYRPQANTTQVVAMYLTPSFSSTARCSWVQKGGNRIKLPRPGRMLTS